MVLGFLIAQKKIKFNNANVVQLVERYPSKLDVVGSSPIIRLYKYIKIFLMEKLFKQLSDAQASLFILFQKTWVYHWDVVGPDFHQLHTLFGEQYNTMFEEIDTLTEHMRYLGMKPVSTLTRIVEVSVINEANSSINANEMIRELRDDNMKICDILTDVSEEADSQRQYATSNLVQSITETHGKFIWTLRSFLE